MKSLFKLPKIPSSREDVSARQPFESAIPLVGYLCKLGSTRVAKSALRCRMLQRVETSLSLSGARGCDRISRVLGLSISRFNRFRPNWLGNGYQ